MSPRGMAREMGAHHSNMVTTRQRVAPSLTVSRGGNELRWTAVVTSPKFKPLNCTLNLVIKPQIKSKFTNFL
jgi:hypothetical protein